MERRRWNTGARGKIILSLLIFFMVMGQDIIRENMRTRRENIHRQEDKIGYIFVFFAKFFKGRKGALGQSKKTIAADCWCVKLWTSAQSSCLDCCRPVPPLLCCQGAWQSGGAPCGTAPHCRSPPLPGRQHPRCLQDG
jgi:hypothetical protein